MSETYLGAFGLKAAPFSKERRRRPLAAVIQGRLVDALCEAVSEHAYVLLTGDPGVGKTCVLRAVRARLPEAGYRLTYCHNATLGRRDFYRQLCLALGLSPKATGAADRMKRAGCERDVFTHDAVAMLHALPFSSPKGC